MRITWFGQACFELVTEDGTVIICDPYHPMVGYAEHPRNADIVTISHEHGDHNHLGWILGSPEIIRGIGNWKGKGVAVSGLPSCHDGEGGAKRGPNTIFIIEADGLRLCHLGDIGAMPDDELYDKIGKPDVLFIPVGGYYTVDPCDAAVIARRIGARLTIPMHFATGVRDVPIAPAGPYADAAGAVYEGGSTITVGKDYAGPATVVLDYLR